MTNQTIDIGCPIDVEKLLDTRLLLQAGSGGGKSFALRKIIEQIARTKTQQIILDPEGEFVTLREKYDFALVSKDGDIPLSVKYAETLAYKLLETNLSVIIDLYELKHHERILFVKNFVSALINAPKELWHSCFVTIDEAHLFCAESTRSESTGAVIDLCTRGRKRGLGAILATQRLSKLHKDAAAELLNKMIGRIGVDIDRKRAGDELGFTSKSNTLELRNLKPGEFYTFGPAISSEVIKFKVAPVETTHLKSGKRMVAAPPTPQAIRKILSRLEALPQDAEKELETKTQLQAEVTRLRREVSLLKERGSDEGEVKALQALNERLVEEKDQALEDARRYHAAFLEANHTLIKIRQISTAQGTPPLEARPVAIAPKNKRSHEDLSYRLRPPLREPEPLRKRLPEGRPAAAPNPDIAPLPKGEEAVLVICAQHGGKGCTRTQLTVMAGFRRSTRDAYISRLQQKGLVQVEAGRVMATEGGMAYLGETFTPLPTGSALRDYWLGALPKGEADVLRLLMDCYPNTLPRDTITEKTGFLRSTRDAYISRLVSRELAETPDRGLVKASPYLFD